MSDDPDNHTLRYLRRLDEKIDRLGASIGDVAVDVRSIKTHTAGFIRNEIDLSEGGAPQ